MKPRLTILAAALGGLTVTSFANAAPVSRDDFQVPTTAQLVSLCSAAQTDPLYTAAVNFCHGFAEGTYRAILQEDMASRTRKKMFCLPGTHPTRDQAISSFVQWAAARPNTLARTPTDGLTEYLITQYPCR
jgi:hypothetical protein